MPTEYFTAKARFFIGQIVHHRKFHYRGVICDADPVYQGTDEWYETVAKSRPPKTQPWYHVLVDGEQHSTYVAERHLEPDRRDAPILHPLVAELCGQYQNGRYLSKDNVQ